MGGWCAKEKPDILMGVKWYEKDIWTNVHIGNDNVYWYCHLSLIADTNHYISDTKRTEILTLLFRRNLFG